MDNTQNKLAIYIGLVISVVTSIVIVNIRGLDTTHSAGIKKGQKQIRRQAVLKGFAKYVTDENGVTTFTWNISTEAEINGRENDKRSYILK